MRIARWPLLCGAGALALAACAPAPVLPPHLVPAAESRDTATLEASSAQALDTPAPQPTVAEARQGRLTDTLTPGQQGGQLFMLGVDTSGLTDATKKAILDGQIGSVVLLGSST